MLLELAKTLQECLVEEFQDKFLSGNLRDTIKLNVMGNDRIEVEIPAELYDLKEWKKSGAIIYTGLGSYAQAVNVYGGFSKTHKFYVERAIEEAVNKWRLKNGINIRGYYE